MDSYSGIIHRDGGLSVDGVMYRHLSEFIDYPIRDKVLRDNLLGVPMSVPRLRKALGNPTHRGKVSLDMPIGDITLIGHKDDSYWLKGDFLVGLSRRKASLVNFSFLPVTTVERISEVVGEVFRKCQ